MIVLKISFGIGKYLCIKALSEEIQMLKSLEMLN
jgi:hypothetical protein